MLLEAVDLQVAIPGRVLVRGLTFGLDAGSMLVVLGPNGAGKTLALHTLAGLREPAAGRVSIMGRAPAEWPRRELAQRLALLPQNIEDPFPATVLQTVLLGRHPHISRWRWESAEDVSVAHAAIKALGLSGYQDRDILTLSGGERRRAAIAAVLAQSPRIFLLDEPTNHLDPGHQIEALKLLRARADSGAAVIVTLHDANLAVRFADQALLLGNHGQWLAGPAASTLTATNLSELYATPFSSIDRPPMEADPAQPPSPPAAAHPVHPAPPADPLQSPGGSPSSPASRRIFFQN